MSDYKFNNKIINDYENKIKLIFKYENDNLYMKDFIIEGDNINIIGKEYKIYNSSDEKVNNIIKYKLLE